MEAYENNLDAASLLAYVKRVMGAREHAASELARPGGSGLRFHKGESVQVLWHNGWRDAHVTRVVGAGDGAGDGGGGGGAGGAGGGGGGGGGAGGGEGAGGGGVEYAVVFEKLPGGEGEESVQFLSIMGAFIRVVGEGGDELDHREHVVSSHVMRLKPQHAKPYEVGELVQLRLSTEWVPGEVTKTRLPRDLSANCTDWAAHGECRRNPKHMLRDCRVACNVSHGELEYEVNHHMSRTWVSAERLLPPQSKLHVGAAAAHAAVEGCLISGQVMVKRVPGLLVVRVDGKKHSFNLKASNMSHAVHHLSFGHSDGRVSSHEEGANEGAGAGTAARRLLPGMSSLAHGLPSSVTKGRAPLDGAAFASMGKHESHEHFLKVVRTTFRPLKEEPVDMYHFTTSSSSHTTQQSAAVTFTYDLSPMQVIIAEESEGLFRFIVYCFAIIGGGFTVFGLIDGVVYYGDRMFREKVGLGKAA